MLNAGPVTIRNVSPWLRVGIVALVIAAAGCGGDSGAGNSSDSAVSSSGKDQAGADQVADCAAADTTPIELAVRNFITSATPTAQRFLAMAGTDSALPDVALSILQDKGPTYFYNGDTVAQRKIREKLAVAGPYHSLLVVYRGETSSEAGSKVSVRLGGQYIGGKDDLMPAVGKRYDIVCDVANWRIESSSEEPPK